MRYPNGTQTKKLSLYDSYRADILAKNNFLKSIHVSDRFIHAKS